MKYTYRTKGTCSQQIDLEINDDIITNVKFYGGCDGNLKAIPILVEGLTVDQIAEKCAGIQCGFKNTSCADQLAKILPALTSWQKRSWKQEKNTFHEKGIIPCVRNHPHVKQN